MRILIANHIDASLLHQADQRAFVQRILWLLNDYDLTILPAPYDPDFLEYVSSFTGVNPQTLKFHVAGPGRFGRKLFDPDSLTDETLLAAVAQDSEEVKEIFALWPSSQVAEFAEALGLQDKFNGASFFSQQGDEIANSKANFRAFAKSLGLAICDGAVCRTKSHASNALRRLLEGGSVMVKQAHNHAGNGNELVTLTSASVEKTGLVGVKRLRSADHAAGYFDKRWEWASRDGSYPVIVERYQPDSRAVYAEFNATDTGLDLNATGSLSYRYGRLVAETIPLRGISADAHDRLVQDGRKLAQLYQRFGYRGILSADALICEGESMVFTEMNARVGGSFHIYEAIGRKIVDFVRRPDRSVTQYVTADHWKIESLKHFIEICALLGIAYEPRTRKGVIVTTPATGEPMRLDLLFCVVSEDESDSMATYMLLEEHFSGL